MSYLRRSEGCWINHCIEVCWINKSFSFNWFIQILHILREKNHSKIFCSDTRAEMMFNPKWLPLQLAEISNSKKKQSAEIFLSNLEIKLHIWKERKHNLKLQKLNFVLELYSINRINTFLKRNKIWYEELCCINRIITFLKRKKKWCKHVKWILF